MCRSCFAVATAYYGMFQSKRSHRGGLEELYRATYPRRNLCPSDRSSDSHAGRTPLLSRRNLHLPAGDSRGTNRHLSGIHGHGTDGSAETAPESRRRRCLPTSKGQGYSRSLDSPSGRRLASTTLSRWSFAATTHGAWTEDLITSCRLHAAMACWFRIRIHGTSRWIQGLGRQLWSAIRRAASHHGPGPDHAGAQRTSGGH